MTTDDDEGVTFWWFTDPGCTKPIESREELEEITRESVKKALIDIATTAARLAAEDGRLTAQEAVEIGMRCALRARETVERIYQLDAAVATLEMWRPTQH